MDIALSCYICDNLLHSNKKNNPFPNLYLPQNMSIPATLNFFIISITSEKEKSALEASVTLKMLLWF
jgi:hypothetical protein